MLVRVTGLLILLLLWARGPAGAVSGGEQWKRLITGGEKASNRGDYASAERLFKQALNDATRRDRVGRDTAISLFEMGVVASKRQEWPQSESLYRQALPLFERLLVRETAGGRAVRDRIAAGSYVDTLMWLGSDYGHQGRESEAEAYFRRALAIQEKFLSASSIDAANCVRSLAVLLCDEGKYAEATPLWRRALATFKARKGPRSVEVCTCLHSLGWLALQQHQYEQGEQFLRQGLALAEGLKEEGRLDKGLCLDELGDLYLHRGMAAQAETLHRQAVAVLEGLGPGEERYLACALLSLGDDCYDRHQYAEAEAHLRRALALREKHQGPTHPRLVECLDAYADVLKATGRAAQATEMEARIRAIRAAHSAPCGDPQQTPCQEGSPAPSVSPEGAGRDRQPSEARAEWAFLGIGRGLILLLAGLCVWGVKASLFCLAEEANGLRRAVLRRNWWSEGGCSNHLAMLVIYLASAFVMFGMAAVILYLGGPAFDWD
jgi:tetratricopeptide (TPR) repeat protein